MDEETKTQFQNFAKRELSEKADDHSLNSAHRTNWTIATKNKHVKDLSKQVQLGVKIVRKLAGCWLVVREKLEVNANQIAATRLVSLSRAPRKAG